MSEEWHGTWTGYRRYRCRCEICVKFNRDYHEGFKRRRASLTVPDRVHGTTNGYGNYGCRCPRCTKANSDYQREYRRKRQVESIEEKYTPDGVGPGVKEEE